MAGMAIVIGIETSCDETAVSIVELEPSSKDSAGVASCKILGNALYSQTKIHEKYGGVFPMLAKREHAKNLVPLFVDCLKQAKLYQTDQPEKKNGAVFFAEKELETIMEREPEMWQMLKTHIIPLLPPKIDAIAVTRGPGLEPALWVGINFAKALGRLWDIPVIPTNHMEGHILISLLREKNLSQTGVPGYDIVHPDFPATALLISGGHTELVLMKNWRNYEIIGKTRDDAVGEAFDKVARMLGLPYPGGPEISRLANKRREKCASNPSIGDQVSFDLPRPMIHSGGLDFSFSGLKTAVLYAVKKLPKLTEDLKEQLSMEFEDAVVETLAFKTKKAVGETGSASLIVGGGVIANKRIREHLAEVSAQTGARLFVPAISHSTDNAVMIGIAGAMKFFSESRTKIYEKNGTDFRASGNWKISEQ